MNRHQKALLDIVDEFKGIDAEDLTTAEQKVLRIAEQALCTCPKDSARPTDGHFAECPVVKDLPR